MQLGMNMGNNISLYYQRMSYPSSATSRSVVSLVHNQGSSPPESSSISFVSCTDMPYYYDLATATSVGNEFARIAFEPELPNMLCSDYFLDIPIKQEPLVFNQGHSTDSVMNNGGSVETLTLANYFCMPRCYFKEVYEGSSSMTCSAQSTSDSETTQNAVPLHFDHDRPSFPSYQSKAKELQPAGIGPSKKRPIKTDPSQVHVVRRAMCKCDYPGCHKAFRRNEHLKRHKQTFHGEGPNRFSCEFCGKDQFNRQDNLNHHRKLHARPNSRNRGVEFVPAAVPVIEQEEGSRKRRAPAMRSRSN